ncbi:MAG: hypothetical protein KAQ89_03515 [Planctomycetes bacterium]|nr:hypothetical protein [Planctomycetota bacterium]
MPLQNRAISGSIAVMCFFAVAIIGWLNQISPFTCCKRAVTAAIIAYAISTLAVKAVNYILIDAMINNQMNQQNKGKNSAN